MLLEVLDRCRAVATSPACRQCHQLRTELTPDGAAGLSNDCPDRGDMVRTTPPQTVWLRRLSVPVCVPVQVTSHVGHFPLVNGNVRPFGHLLSSFPRSENCVGQKYYTELTQRTIIL